MPEMEVVSSDPSFRQASEAAKLTLHAVLRECGVDIDRFEGPADSELQIEDLQNLLGRAWTMLARASSLKEQWRKKLAEREEDYELQFANAYSKAGEELPPKATETAKKNWIIQNDSSVKERKGAVAEAKYLVGMCESAVKSLETRCHMLQSINKLRITEMERLSGVPFEDNTNS